jgi:hypothetical protein
MKLEDVFSHKKHQRQERNDIKCQQADDQEACNDIDGWQLNKMQFNSRYRGNKQKQS